MAMLNIAKYLEGTVEMAQWLRVQMTVFGSQHMSDSLHQPITPAPENKMISSSFQGHTLPWAHIYMHSHIMMLQPWTWQDSSAPGLEEIRSPASVADRWA